MNLLIILFAVDLLGAAQHPTMPSGMSHEGHLEQMQKEAALKRRGAGAMGFDQDGAVHHFRLSPRGGAIEVEARDVADSSSVSKQIRSHLQGITDDFARGDFAKPRATHAEVPPGAIMMRQRKAVITYRYEERPGGARVVIDTTDPQALIAVHNFLRYQITEHKTGDSTAPGKSEANR